MGKKGLLYRLRKMYVYSRRAKKWFRTRRFSWRRMKRKEGSAHWSWGKTIKKNGKLYRMRVQYAFKGKKWVPTGKKYARRVKWSWRKAYKKKKRHLFRLRVMYTYHKKGKKWFRTHRQYWALVQWRWRKAGKIKKGLLYRLRKMYVYSRRAKKWFRTRRFYWRRMKRKEGSTGWMWMGAPKKRRDGGMVRLRVLVVWKGHKWVTTGKKYWRCFKKCRRRRSS